MDAVTHLLRRSRRSFAAKAHHNLVIPRIIDNASQERVEGEVVWIGEELDKRFYASLNQFSPGELSSMAAASSAAAAAATKKTTALLVTSTARQAAQAATRGTTLSSRTPVTTPVLPATTKAAATSAPKVVSLSSSVVSSLALSAVRSTSTTHSTSTSSSTVKSTSTTSLNTNTVLTITETPSTTFTSTSSTAASATAINGAASGSTSSKSDGLSTGGIVGVVLAVLVGLVVVGSAIGWLYRKHVSRGYSDRLPWQKMDEDDVTPFPPNEKLIDTRETDIYGASPAPVIGSRRALALARQNAFAADGSLRPDSQYLDNRAGLGAGNLISPLVSPDYGVDAQGRPYRQQAGRTPIQYQNYSQPPIYASPPRQLAGPQHPYDQPVFTPVALGRPAAPHTQAQLDQLDDFADMPETHATGHGLPYDRVEVYNPVTPPPEWSSPGQSRSRVSMTTPKARPDSGSATAKPAAQTPLPFLEPMSPLMGGYDLRRTSQPLPMYAPESTPSMQKRMYGEVARAAGIAEPLTPRTPLPALNVSTSSTDSNQTTSSFSAHESMRLPSMPTPQPYVHGRPLSPLTEVATPISIQSTRDPAQPSSSVLHGQRHEVNPFERALLPPRNNWNGTNDSLTPRSAVSRRSGLGYPSPAYPPSPGGMSVPGSVGSSPRGWSGDRRSLVDEEDAYGGI